MSTNAGNICAPILTCKGLVILFNNSLLPELIFFRRAKNKVLFSMAVKNRNSGMSVLSNT